MTDTTITLAQRRQMLIARCGLQRVEAGHDIMELRQSAHAPEGLRHFLGGDLKVPLTIAGVVLGMIVAKPRRALPILTAGLSLWKFARPLLNLLKRAPTEE